MDRLLITTLSRGPDAIKEVGRIYEVDLYSGKVSRDPVVLPEKCMPSSIPGNSWGARGMCTLDGVLYVAGSYKTIFKYDVSTLHLLDILVFDEFKWLHQIKARDGSIYVSSTGNDRRCIISDDCVVSCTDLSVNAPIIDTVFSSDKPWGDDRLHFNSLCFVGEEEYHLYYSPGIIFNFTRGYIVCQDKVIKHGHDIVPFREGFLINSSARKSTYYVCPDGAFLVYKHDGVGECFVSNTNVYGYTRGLVYTGTYIIIGTSPGTIVVLDDDFNIVNKITVTSSKYESIFDLLYI